MKKTNSSISKKNIFNKWEFEQALALSKTVPLEAKLLYERYIEKYPKDYTVIPYYASVLIILGEFAAAEKILNYVENKYKSDSGYMKKQDKVNFLEKFIAYDRLKIFCYRGKYKEFLNFCDKNQSILEDIDLGGSTFFCNSRMENINKDTRDNQSYLFKQMIEYREYEFFEHIKKHLSDYNQDDEEVNDNVFVPNFPIKKVIEEIKTKIPSDIGLRNGFFEISYIFKYDGCGRENNKLVDFFKVICFKDTHNFITMCPVFGYERAPYIDLNYIKEKEEENFVKVKRKSQIDKFNSRYKK